MGDELELASSTKLFPTIGHMVLGFTGNSPPPTPGLVLLQKGYKGCSVAFPLIWKWNSHWVTIMDQGEVELGQLNRE